MKLDKKNEKKQMKILAAELAMINAFQQQYSVGLKNTEAKEPTLDQAMTRFVERLKMVPEHGGYQNHWREMTALAGGKLAFYRSVQETDNAWYKDKHFLLRSIMVPVFLLILTALLGNWVAASLQESSFKRKQVFQYKLTFLKEGRVGPSYSRVERNFPESSRSRYRSSREN
jgi:hypothetical protein